MRLMLLPAVLLSLASCGTPATLYTDEVFRNAVPEVCAAWASMVPWRPAATKELPPGSGTAALEAELARSAPGSVVLVGMALSTAERTSLQTAHPQVRMLFFTSSGEATDLAEVTVSRQEAWSAVAAAAAGPVAAVAFFPADVDTEEMEAFERAWKAAGGGALNTAVGYQADKLSGSTEAVFHWAGPELDGPVQSLVPSVKIHGNPGTPRAPGASGLTWVIRKSGLGDFLWSAALDPKKKKHFLPLETVLERR